MPSVESDEQAEASTAENAQTATDIFRLTAKIYSPLSAIRRGAVATARCVPTRPADAPTPARMVAHYSAGATAERGAVAKYL